MPQTDAITLRQLRALAAVARHGSITLAAEALRLTPPAVHTQLRLLEANVACALLDRSRAGRTLLTPEGQALLDAVNRAEAALATGFSRVGALQKGLTGTVRLGVVSTGKYFAPRLVAQIQAAHPEIDVVLRIGNRDATIALLADGSIDLAIMGRAPQMPAVTAVPVGPHPHGLIAAPGHRLASGAMAGPAEILREKILAREQGSGTRILMTRYLDRIGDGHPYQTIEMESNETIKQAVMAGLGIALISLHTVTEELRTGRLVLINAEGLPLQRLWYLMTPEGRVLTGAVSTIHAFIDAQQGRFLPALPGM